MTISRAAPRRLRLAPWLLLIAAVPAQASRVEVRIDPSTTQIAYTVFALGLIPVQARFERFSGTLSVDPADPGACDVHVLVEVTSLRMADPARTAQALGPPMLDAGRYPTMRFDGQCEKGGVSGTLGLHGVSRMLTLSKRREGPVVISTTTLRRQDYGVSGMPYLIGPRVQLRFTTHLPQSLARR